MVCKLCDGADVRHFYTSRGLNLPIMRCRQCGLTFVGQAFDSSTQEAFYGAPGDYRVFAEAERSLPEVRRRHLEWLQQIRRYVDLSDHGHRNGRTLRLLDVGCGAGDFLAVARDAGFEVQGLEISAPAAALAYQWHGIEVAVRTLDADPRDDFFDVVTTIGVLEHVEDPRALLRHAHRVLAPCGVLFIYTPVWGTYDRLTSALARVSNGWLTRPIDRRINRAHLQILQRPTIVNAMGKLGFDVVASDTLCEYNIPVKHYLGSIGITHPELQALSARCLKALIDRKLFFRNNMRVVVRKV